MALFSRKTETPEPLVDNTVYLIDTENVRTVWTLLLDRMTENDKIYVFYTMNSGNVSYEDLNGVISSGKNVELIQCHTGKNGLDFQLVSYLGYLIKSNENADYCIISDDSGYDAVLKFWEGRDVDVTRKTAAQVSGKPARAPKKPLFGAKKKTVPRPAKPTPKPATQAPKPAAPAPALDISDPCLAKLKELLPDEPAERLIKISEIVKASGGKSGLADIHDEIEKLYRNEKASEIYRIVRHNISDIYV